MAPPANRRSGFSRRAQYTTFFSYAAGVLGVVIGLGLLVVSYVRPDAFAFLRGAAADVTEPASQASAKTRAAGHDVWAEISGFVQRGSRTAQLERELASAKSRLVAAQATEVENARLKALLGVREEGGGQVAYARLTASTGGSTRRYATLGAGADRGVTKGMPVRSEVGLVGRVLEVGHSTSRVLLITDTESIVPVRRARDGVAGFAQGHGDGTIRIRLINLGLNPLRKGDAIVTSGSGGLYRPNTPIAVVTELLRDGAIARVVSNPSDTDYVLIEKAWSLPDPPPPAPLPGSKKP
ncbi:rod shape-determining protein MreC [Novosphingobium sp. Rr 2-17]|uniref:rod shape-determining protein MreC n=1 Tax=Novosphingobium sp. Rr 2-17 TaxID=555793 RepID=UPI0002698F24|nr:rod shape-determining protein MreC [Novosphingobium sp. Rr 2-17]EIZ77489.1 rod shape-determining protein MreC [Novosphingobium sp. Rr 2-17]